MVVPDDWRKTHFSESIRHGGDLKKIGKAILEALDDN
jgi:hypothetical protein